MARRHRQFSKVNYARLRIRQHHQGVIKGAPSSHSSCMHRQNSLPHLRFQGPSHYARVQPRYASEFRVPRVWSAGGACMVSRSWPFRVSDNESHRFASSHTSHARARPTSASSYSMGDRGLSALINQRGAQLSQIIGCMSSRHQPHTDACAAERWSVCGMLTWLVALLAVSPLARAQLTCAKWTCQCILRRRSARQPLELPAKTKAWLPGVSGCAFVQGEKGGGHGRRER
jgi:hypothetical protein